MQISVKKGIIQRNLSKSDTLLINILWLYKLNLPSYQAFFIFNLIRILVSVFIIFFFSMQKSASMINLLVQAYSYLIYEIFKGLKCYRNVVNHWRQNSFSVHDALLLAFAKILTISLALVKDATVFCIVDNNGTLIIHDSNIKRDVGSYKCTATNRAGTSKDIATLNKPGKSNYLWLIWYLSDQKKLKREACQATRTFQSGF